MPEASSREQLEGLLREAELLVCVGPGGVGKTTLAAALGVRAAVRGRRVLVLTIDPARRLADALGLDGLDDRIRQIPGASLAALGAKEGGALYAAMLDTKASYDSLIGRIALDPARRDRILENAVYRAFSRTLARSHAYVAMERLYDSLHDPRFDLVILDTPPTRSALTILDAPGALLRFLDDRVLSAFVGRAEGGSEGSAPRLAARGGAMARRLFGLLVGERVVEELVGFFEVFLHLRAGFAERAAATQAALRGERTAFLLVSAPASTQLFDAAFLRAGLREREAPLRLSLFNRAFDDFSDFHGKIDENSEKSTIDEDLTSLFGSGFDPELVAALAELREARDRAIRADRSRRARIHAFAAGDPSPALLFPYVEREPTRLADLAALIEGAREERGA